MHEVQHSRMISIVCTLDIWKCVVLQAMRQIEILRVKRWWRTVASNIHYSGSQKKGNNILEAVSFPEWSFPKKSLENDLSYSPELFWFAKYTLFSWSLTACESCTCLPKCVCPATVKKNRGSKDRNSRYQTLHDGTDSAIQHILICGYAVLPSL